MPIPSIFGTVLAKIETVVGTDASPSSSNAIMVMSPIVDVTSDTRVLDIARSKRSTPGVRVGEQQAAVSFSVEMVGAGSVALPNWVVLLKGCGMQSSGTTVTPLTASPPTLTLYVYYGSVLHVMLGCVGTFSLKAEAGMTPVLDFTFHGLYAEPVNSAGPTPTYSVVVPPIMQSASLSFHSASNLIVQSFSLDIGNEIKMLSDSTKSSGFRAARITKRQVTGGINPEVVASYDFWNRLTNETKASLSVQIGLVSGNRLLITSSYSQITGIGYTDRDSLRTFDLAIAFCRGPSGDDEFSMFFD